MQRRLVRVVLVIDVLAIAVDYAQACGRRRRCCCNVCYVVPVKPVRNCFKFETPFDFTANNKGVTAQITTDEIKIELEGDKAVLATFAGEKVKLAATCQVQLPAGFYEALEKTANVAIYRKAINVPLESTLDDEGVAVFSKKVIHVAVHAELMRLRFWDQPALFGIEDFNIEITGAARVGSFVFKSSNCRVLPGTVE